MSQPKFLVTPFPVAREDRRRIPVPPPLRCLVARVVVPPCVQPRLVRPLGGPPSPSGGPPPDLDGASYRALPLSLSSLGNRPATGGYG
jgi:hypothetical protein